MKNKLIGKLAGTSAVIEVEYDRALQRVDELIHPPGTDLFLAPGFIDVQVNGFAGVDYNDPACPKESIAASIQTMFTTGVTRLFPTVITGSRERMLGALKNLTAAKEEFQRNGWPEADGMEAFHVEGPHIRLRTDREALTPSNMSGRLTLKNLSAGRKRRTGTFAS